MAAKTYMLNYTSLGSKQHRITNISLRFITMKSKFVCEACKTENRMESFPLTANRRVGATLMCINCEATFRVWTLPDPFNKRHMIYVTGDVVIPFYYPHPEHVLWGGEIYIVEKKATVKVMFCTDTLGNWVMGRKDFKRFFGKGVPYDPPSVRGLSIHLHEYASDSSGIESGSEGSGIESGSEGSGSESGSEGSGIESGSEGSGIESGSDYIDDSEEDDDFKSGESEEEELVKKVAKTGYADGNGSPMKLVEVAKENLKRGVSPKEILDTLSGSHQKKANALYEALLDGVEDGFADHLVERKSYLTAILVEGEDSQLVLLRAVEEFCGKSNPKAAMEVSLVLKKLYDADILEEQYVLKWYEEGLNSENKMSLTWKYAKPFVEWLRTAESESEED